MVAVSLQGTQTFRRRRGIIYNFLSAVALFEAVTWYIPVVRGRH